MEGIIVYALCQYCQVATSGSAALCCHTMFLDVRVRYCLLCLAATIEGPYIMKVFALPAPYVHLYALPLLGESLFYDARRLYNDVPTMVKSRRL